MRSEYFAGRPDATHTHVIKNVNNIGIMFQSRDSRLFGAGRKIDR